MYLLSRLYLPVAAVIFLAALYLRGPGAISVPASERQVNPLNPTPTAEPNSPSEGGVKTQPAEPTSGPGLRAGQCISSFDCPDGQACFSWTLSPSLTPAVGNCTIRTPLGGDCSATRICAEGLDCRGIPQVCTAPGNEGEPCQSNNRFCVDGLVCAPSSLCSKPLALGEKCTDQGQCEDSAFCQFDSSDGPFKCETRKPVGEPCKWDDYCLSGFCDGSIPPRCAAPRAEGGSCRAHSYCRGDLRCIGLHLEANDFIGKCTARDKVVSGRGLPCDLELGNCDDAKGLICRPREGGPICIEELRGSSVCNPTSTVQICRPEVLGFEGRPAVCRERLSFPEKKPTGEFNCLTPFVDLEKGQICNAVESARCRENLVCDTVPGVGREDSARNFRTRYCREPIGVGEDCSDPFETTCAPGGRCEDGVCVAIKPVSPTLFAGRYEDCSSLECARGLSCGDSSICILEPVVVPEGELCGSNATNKINCEPGFGCLLPFNKPDRDYRARCRKLSQEGEDCGQGRECLEPLICEDFNAATQMGKCRDPNVGLNVGDPCDPQAISEEQQCGFKTECFPRKLVCAPHGSAFVCKCQIYSGESCIGVENAICEEGTSCSDEGKCVSKT